MEKSWTPIDSHCKNFNSLFLSWWDRWDIPKKCPSQIYKQWKSNLNTSWECSMCDNSELSCWKFYNGSQWGVYDFPMLEIGNFFRINPDLRINPNLIPYHLIVDPLQVDCWPAADWYRSPNSFLPSIEMFEGKKTKWFWICSILHAHYWTNLLGVKLQNIFWTHCTLEKSWMYLLNL